MRRHRHQDRRVTRFQHRRPTCRCGPSRRGREPRPSREMWCAWHTQGTQDAQSDRFHRADGRSRLAIHRQGKAKGKQVEVAIAPIREVNDAAAALAAAEAGHGITSLYSSMVGESIRTGRSVPLLRPHWLAGSPVPSRSGLAPSRRQAPRLRRLDSPAALPPIWFTNRAIEAVQIQLQFRIIHQFLDKLPE